MNFEPVSMEEAEGLLLAGEYPCEVLNAEESVSKKGNEMIKMTVKVYRPNGSHTLLTDYLLPSFAKKLISFCHATDMMDKYEKGSISSDDCIGKSCRVLVNIEENEIYGKKNRVVSYNMTTPEDVVSNAKDFEDDLPF